MSCCCILLQNVIVLLHTCYRGLWFQEQTTDIKESHTFNLNIVNTLTRESRHGDCKYSDKKECHKKESDKKESDKKERQSYMNMTEPIYYDHNEHIENRV